MKVLVAGMHGELLGAIDVRADADCCHVPIKRAGVACSVVIDGKPFDLEPKGVLTGETIRIEIP